jgi:2-polyprenyl-6-methoxyphenol hydroxylase-like FAD-dependent oxidoreductase
MEDPSTNNNITTTTNSSTTIRVLVIGAGPGGLLAAINLLRRNEKQNHATTNIKYHVTLVDPGVDYGALDEAGLSKHRSWMIGLTSHGTSAIREIPGLYPNYVEQLGVPIKWATTGFGPYYNMTSVVPEKDDNPGFCVDRNYVCAALARYLTEKYGNKTTKNNNEYYRPLYLTRALFVDGENKQVLVRPVAVNNNDATTTTTTQPSSMTGIDYDVLLGCDGIRSIVRNAFITTHRDFEFDLQDAFGIYKSTHLTLPKEVGEGHFMFLVNPMPNTGQSERYIRCDE